MNILFKVLTLAELMCFYVTKVYVNLVLKHEISNLISDQKVEGDYTDFINADREE